MIEVGQDAPDFTLPGVENGAKRDYTLSEYRGRKVVIAFYPGDNTPGCTRQMCSYRDNLADLEATGAVLLGISPQDVDSHESVGREEGLHVPAARRRRQDGDRGVRRGCAADRRAALGVRGRPGGQGRVRRPQAHRGHLRPDRQARSSTRKALARCCLRVFDGRTRRRERSELAGVPERQRGGYPAE